MDNSCPVLSWVHFGDLHLTEMGQPNHADLLALIAAVNQHMADGVDFAVLPGDNADNGTDAQFRLVRQAMDRLDLDLHILPGDHDFETGSLSGFHQILGVAPLPASHLVAGHRCLFLDVVSAGSGGPDFRLGPAQLNWLGRALADALAAKERVVVFMHTYPADLRDCAKVVTQLFAAGRVACVDMGHTHYNELANDGRTIFAATRSTGQIEEGPVGFSVAAVDRGAVSWRFQPLAGEWPLVLITHPADRRLVTEVAQIVCDTMHLRAKVWGAASIRTMHARVGKGPPVLLQPEEDGSCLWSATCRAPADGLHAVTVEAADADGRVGRDRIDVLVSRSGAYEMLRRHGDGSDKDTIGAWTERHMLGTQLGPNRNGKQW